VIEHLALTLDFFGALIVEEIRRHACVDKVANALALSIERKKLLPPFRNRALALRKDLGHHRLHEAAGALALEFSLAVLSPGSVMRAFRVCHLVDLFWLWGSGRRINN